MLHFFLLKSILKISNIILRLGLRRAISEYFHSLLSFKYKKIHYLDTIIYFLNKLIQINKMKLYCRCFCYKVSIHLLGGCAPLERSIPFSLIEIITRLFPTLFFFLL